jgi:hypothetical protein
MSGTAHVHDLLPEDPFRAFSSVVAKYSSRSRWNLSCMALKFATRAAISARTLATRSLCSVILPILFDFDSGLATIGRRDWGVNGTSGHRCGRTLTHE